MEKCFEMLKKEAGYARASRSRDLMYEAYGRAKMACELDAITWEQFLELNTLLVVEGINRPASYDRI